MKPLQPEIRRLEKALALFHRASGASAARAVHELRVSARRIDVYLRLAELRVLRDDLRWLIASLGPLRDKDVVMSMGVPGSSQFQQWLKASHRQALVTAGRELAGPRVQAIVEGLGQVSSFPLHPHRVLRKLEADYQAQRRVTRRKRNVEVLHRERKLLKRLRYAHEWLGHDTQPFKLRQELLGGVCDLECLVQVLTEFGAREASRVVSVGVQRVVRDLTGGPSIDSNSKRVLDRRKRRQPSK